MRLDRRKNRDSRDRRRNPSGRDPESPSEGPPEGREERRLGLARAVRSMRSDDAEKRPLSGYEGAKRAAARAERREVRPPAVGSRRDGGEAQERDVLPRAARSVAADTLGIGREILRWPARIWMAVAEALGSAILVACRRAVTPALRLIRRWLVSALRWGERAVTPARGLAVAVAATIALDGSQFGDYRAVEIGTHDYAKVESVAPAPQVDQAMPRSAHGIWVFAIAVACLFVIVLAIWRNWRLARLLLFGGVAVAAISLFVDRPEGLRLGTAGEAYSGAHAILLGPFWVQLFAGATLAIVGPLLAARLRGERTAARRRSPGRAGEEARAKRAPTLRPGVGT
jgi:hypothetical protein